MAEQDINYTVRLKLKEDYAHARNSNPKMFVNIVVRN